MTEYLHLYVLFLLVFMLFAGIDVALALGLVSLVAMFASTGDWEITLSFISSTAYEALRDYLFAVVPLFLLMGGFIAKSGMASDIFWAIDNWMSRLPGRFAFATIIGNVVFSFVSGTSLASATTFTSIAYPEMKRAGYPASFSLGIISGSACLGMLIPPSLLMVVWGILTDISIGHLFLAGVLPGFLLALLMLIYVGTFSLFQPNLVGDKLSSFNTSKSSNGNYSEALSAKSPSVWSLLLSILGLAFITFLALGGIWAGFFTPTEGAAVGALISLLVSVLKGMSVRTAIDVVVSVGRIAVPLMILVFSAQLYSRTLAMSGIGSDIQALILSTEWSLGYTILFMVGIWLFLGMFIDSISIMLLTVPIFWPIANSLGIDPLAFALIGILTVEAGLLTPPFGLVAYAVKSVIPDEPVSMREIFSGAFPFMFLLLIVGFLIFWFPGIATWLPSRL